MKKQKNGFTLFELLVSISIIGILTALGVASFSSAQQKARDSRRIQDMDVIQKAAEQYYSAHGTYSYPIDTSLTNWVVNGTSVLQKWPVDPKPAPWTQYNYTSSSPYTSYCACANLEGSSQGNSDTNACDFAATTSLTFYCVHSQQ